MRRPRMECNGMQVFEVPLSPLFGAGDGGRTRDVQLGNTHGSCLSPIYASMVFILIIDMHGFSAYL